MTPESTKTPEAYLHSKGYSPKRAPGEWLIRCFACGDSSNKRHAHLYVNQEHGAWKCHRCGASGSFAELQRAHGDEPEKTDEATAARWLVLRHALQICQDTLLDYPLALNYLRAERKLTAETIGKYVLAERKLTAETIGKYELGYMDQTFVGKMRSRGYTLADLREAGLIGEKSNTPLFMGRIIIPYINRETVVALRGKEMGGNTLQTKGVTLGLFGTDNIRAQEGDMYVCEGEFDTMFLDQQGYPSVGLPGADTFQETWVTWFEKARRVFVVLDADDAGARGAEKVKDGLGAKARVVELPVPENEKSTDIQEYFLRDGYTIVDFNKLIDSYRGARLYTVADALDDREELKNAEGLLLGWKDLDHWIHPGLLPGQVMVILAKTGIGKTAWVSQVLHNLSEYWIFEDGGHKPVGPSVPTLMLSLEQTKAELVERMWRISRLWDPWMDDDQFNFAYRNVRLNDENKIPPGDIRFLIDEFIEEVEVMPKLLILDYLGYWARSFQGRSRYEQVSDAIMELKALAKEFAVSIIVPHQVSRVGKRGQRLELDFARDSGVVEETADFAFSLWSPHTQEERDDTDTGILQRADVRIEILKSRHGGVGRETKMLWAPASLALPPAAEPRLKKMILKEYEWIDRGKLYEEIHKMHRSGYG